MSTPTREQGANPGRFRSNQPGTHTHAGVNSSRLRSRRAYTRIARGLDRTALAALLSYDPITGEIRWRVNRANQHAGQIAGGVGLNGYRRICINYRRYYEHHLALVLSGIPTPPRGFCVDHIDGNPLNNALTNLRVVTFGQNGHNRKRLNANNTSGASGVIKKRAKFAAQIMVNRKGIYLGSFDTFEQAKNAREAANVSHP
jgi:hypothetical protein